MSRPLSADDVREILKGRCEEAGGQTAWAIRHGMSSVLVNNVIHGRRSPSRRILAPLGLVEREPVYEAAQASGPRL